MFTGAVTNAACTVGAYAVSSLLAPLGFGRWGDRFRLGGLNPRRMPSSAKDQRIVVFLHGVGGNPSQFLIPHFWMRRAGFHGLAYTVNYSSEERRAKLQQRLQAIGQQYREQFGRCARIVLVGHSLGGITAAEEMLDPAEGDYEIDRAVLISTRIRPNDRRWLGQRFYADIRPNVEKISTRFHELSKRVSLVAGTADRIVPLYSSGHTWVTQAQRLILPYQGHLSALFHPDTAKFICRTLTE